MAWNKTPGFLIAFTFCSAITVAQNISYRPFYVELHVTPQLSFGSSAEIRGGYDPTMNDEEHLNLSFKENTTEPEIIFGYGWKQWELQSSFRYFRQDITLNETYVWSTDGPKLATASFISARVSALMLVSKPKWRPYGLYSGFFMEIVSATSYTIDPQVKVDYGVQDIRTQTQLGYGIETNFSFALGKKGFYGNVGASFTLPGTMGCVGKVEMESSGYTIVYNSIDMYSLKFFVGVGFRMGKQITSPVN